MRRMLVLGASGFIGRHLVQALASADVVQTVAAARRAPQVPAGVLSQAVDATDAEALGAALQGVDGVVNCIAGSPATIRANAAALVRAAARQATAPRIVHLSSMAVYGNARGLIDETAPSHQPLDAYARAKLDAERMLEAYPRTVILRPGCVYGPGGARWSLCIARLLLARRLGDLGLHGQGHSNLVHVNDVVEATLRALFNASADGHRFNLAAAQSPDWNTYFTEYAQALGVRNVPRIAPMRLRLEGLLLAPALHLAMRLGQAAGVPAERIPPAITPSMLRLWSQPLALDVRKAQTLLKLSWTPLSQGLKDTTAWVAQLPVAAAGPSAIRAP